MRQSPPFSQRARGSTPESGSASHNPTQQMAQTWMQHRQQEHSVLASHGSGSLDAQPARPDRSPGRLLSRHSMHSAAVPTVNHQVPSRSTSLTHTHSSSFTRRQPEPRRNLDEEWPVVGTPPVNLPKHTPLNLPPPSPSRQGMRPQHQPQTQQPTQPPAAPFGLQGGWAAGLARGAEWMGEATGLRFLSRPFQRAVAPDTAEAETSNSATAPPSHSTSPVRRHNTDSRGQSLPIASSPTTSSVRETQQAAAHSLDSNQDNRLFSASAPGHSGMSYRERLLAGAAASNTSAASNRPAESFSRQPGQLSQMGFPSQQELQASQAHMSHQTASSSSTSTSQCPAGHLSQLVPQANHSQDAWTSMLAQPRQGLPTAALWQNGGTPQEPTPVQMQQEQPAEQAVQFTMPSAAPDGPAAFPDFNWPAQVTLNGQLLETQQNIAAALPPSMLNMGWEYPAQLLQGADPVLSARQRGGREDAAQQPNNAVSIPSVVSCCALL